MPLLARGEEIGEGIGGRTKVAYSAMGGQRRDMH